MARVWTREQSLAIDTRDRTLLVSAAAGSGKTATLTERIIRSILDEDHPLDIGKMLIVTFTNAAVGELRERISAAVKDASLKNPGNARLERQLLSVKDAKIMTISSFCNDILKQNSAKVGLPSGYRIADEAEAELIMKEVIEPLINLCYEGLMPEVCSAEEFAHVADALTSARSEAELAESFKMLYRATECYADRLGTLLSQVEEYDPENFTGVEGTRLGAYILDHTKEALLAYRDMYSRAMRHFSSTDCSDAERKTEAAFLSDVDFITSALRAEGYDELYGAMSAFELAKRATVRGEKSVGFETLLGIRDMFKADMQKLRSDFFTYTTDEWRELYARLYKNTTIIYKFIEKLDSELSKEKKLRGVCEYGDLERYAYECLYEKGEPTMLARELAASFEAVYIDEYQDVNDLENKIFEAVSRPDNRFMVGDIKQSIYGFRLANPDIFASMKSSFPPLGNSGDYPGASIFMSSNFRSDKTIIDFANGVFDNLFGALGKSIGYVEADRLGFAKVYAEGEAPTGIEPEIHVLSSDAEASDDEGDSAEAEILGSAEASAEAVAAKIRDLLESGTLANGKRPRPSDIAIMMRSTKTSGEVYRNALAKHGIGAAIKDSGNFFLNEEILLALSLLNAIDNPRRDIYLAALMCSPLYAFTHDELYLIRRSSDKETLYEAILERRDEPKIERLIGDLERYRMLAEGTPIDVLLALLYNETGLFALAAKSGRQDNLTLLHSYARRFETSSFGGLYSFISYVNGIIRDEAEFDLAKDGAEEDAVNIITIHKSKGLEYPICFLVGTESRTKRAPSARLIYSEGFGIGLKEKDDGGLAVVENPAYNAVKAYIQEKEYEEELRVLYVALTRPREQLYIYGVPRGDRDKFMAKLELQRELFSPYIAKNLSTTLGMIAVCRESGVIVTSESIKPTLVALPEASATVTEAEEAHRSPEEMERIADELVRRFTFVYPEEYKTRIPSKLSVSRLYPEILDGEDETAHLETKEEHEARPILPGFIEGSAAEESAKRGIATHLVMQFADFKRMLELGPSAEIKRLTDEGFISADDARRVRVRELDAFLRSALLDEILSAKAIYRELRFNALLPASDFTADKERAGLLENDEVLVQGVIDCLIEKADGSLKLVDYKTDRLLPEEKENRALAEERLAKKHARQLGYYKDAVLKMFGKAPAEISIYSLSLGKEIRIG